MPNYPGAELSRTQCTFALFKLLAANQKCGILFAIALMKQSGFKGKGMMKGEL